jgi:pyridinium-3,5-biscarboxylic acid mononucleotide sulfurtransferase
MMNLNIENIATLSPETQLKWSRLVSSLRQMGSAVVAFSGGVDSSLLSAAAGYALGERALAVTISSPVNVAGETEAAMALAAQIGLKHLVVSYNDLENPQFVANSPERCYHCKLARFDSMVVYAREHQFAFVLEGTNSDDGTDYRPGKRAVTELGVRSPLAETALKKFEIRQLAEALGLPTWDRPSSPCLATRFPYGTQVTQSGLVQVAQAEQILHQHGFEPVRVRCQGDTARIEVSPTEIPRLAALAQYIVSSFKGIGFKYISVDLQGYRQGSLNEVLVK